MTWAGTRSAVFERMCSTPAATSASWRLRRSSGPPASKKSRATKYRKFSHAPSVRPSRKRASSSWRSSWWPRSTKATSSSSRSRARPVTRLESEWVLEEAKYSGASPQRVLVELAAHGRPPAPGHALVADLGAAEHAQAHRLAAFGDRLQVVLEVPPQASASRAQSSGAPPSAAAHASARRRPRSAASRRRASAGGSCSTRSGRRRASARGRRRRTPRPAGRPAPRRRCRTSAAAAPRPRRPPTPPAARSRRA